MTTNQTIDGALRELLLRVLDPYRPRGQEKARKELRALLEAPVNPLSELEVLRAAVKELEAMRDARFDAKLAQSETVPFGWWRVPRGLPLQGMFLHYDPIHGERDIQNALDFGFTVKRLYNTPAAQPQGEPVAWVECSPSWLKAGGDCATAPRLCVGRDGISHLHPAHAEQAAPVAHTMKTVMAAICSIDGFPMLTSNQCHALAVKLNDCLDEQKRLNPSL